jgi:hypothetical protein
LSHQINRLKSAEVQKVINSLKSRKSSGYDFILAIIGIKYRTQLFNAALLKEYFPTQWQAAQIIRILKSGKPPDELTS